ncbi:MAG: hypothetical protein AAGC58_13820 [Asticcacaulis sp.]
MSFTIGNVFSRSFTLIGQNFALLLLTGLLTYAIPVGLSAAIFYTTSGLDVNNPQAWGGEQVMALGLFGILSMLFYFINMSVVTELTVTRAVNRPFDIGPALKRSLINIVPLFIVMILCGLAIMLGFILLIIPGIIVSLALSVAIPAYVAESRTGIIDALKRSWELTKNHRWAILLIFILIGIFGAIFGGIIQAVSMIFAAQSPALIIGLNSIIEGLYTLISTVFTVVIYVVLRESKEGNTSESTASVFE